MKICSFDPSSTRNLGYAVASLENTKGELYSQIKAGTFVLEPKEERPLLLWSIFQIIDSFLSENCPELVIIEQTGSFSGGFITSQISNCIGVILACCGKHKIKVITVYPTHVKKIITGKGKATKSEMRKSVIGLLQQLKIDNTKYNEEHTYDAIANILTFMHESKDINFEIKIPEICIDKKIKNAKNKGHKISN
ncbi:MAG: crossover junction endodeoxyribonuclease RuvC [Candidatus Woesearchaeota archaeon]|jgi:Holliday junction resolvasome RuvABC endonuclease subunit